MSISLDRKLVDQARTVETFAWIAAGLLALQALALLGLLSLISPIIRGDGEGFAEAFREIAPRLVGLLPAVFYFSGLVAAAKIFGRVSRGELFSEANAGGLAEVGSSILWGAIATAALVPIIRNLIAGEHMFGGVHLEPETWVIGVIGGAIMVLGRMMRHGMRIQNELDSII